MSEQSFILIGLDDNRQQYFPPQVEELIRNGHLFSGGARHREIIKEHLPEGAVWIPITVPLDPVFRAYATHREPIIVFASGDPLFFGFAVTIQKRLPDASIRLYPAFNSLQTLAHRLVMRYDDMRTVSLTGRPWHEFDRALIERSPKIGVLTDREHTPATIAARMLAYGYDRYSLYLGEHLGNREKERIRHLTLQEATQATFEHPNNLLLVANSPLPPRPFGIPDEEFAHLDGRSRMITKAPIRLVTLSQLNLGACNSFWDVGFCTGSVSIEAKLQFPHLSVTAFEIRPEGEKLMNDNSRRFGTPGIETYIGDFLAADLSRYPRPDAVFIGGHGGKLNEIILRLSKVLLPGGVIVLNAVQPESKALFEAGVSAAGFRQLPGMQLAIDTYNPIEILKAVSPIIET
ncbi:precorrin-6y C5,15-methyltransferase (decarboxylating) subunit CbiE [Bacteroides sp.]|uniref:precorrin-6y C5,15-methyltransferase (decarboxylating) subunit CbiE n=1 Tax=Bacteroides sp. TaxID=29523 RepID=UPI002FCAFA98